MQGKSGSAATALGPVLAEQPWTRSDCGHHLPWAVQRQE